MGEQPKHPPKCTGHNLASCSGLPARVESEAAVLPHLNQLGSLGVFILGSGAFLPKSRCRPLLLSFVISKWTDTGLLVAVGLGEEALEARQAASSQILFSLAASQSCF